MPKRNATPPASGDLQIQYVPIGDIRPADVNARTHSDAQVKQIADSIDQFGFNNPILVDERNQIVAGHGRLAAAIRMGLERVPIIQLSNLSEARKRAFALADNRIALNSGWDEDTLRKELLQLNEQGEVDLERLGFDEDELRRHLGITGNEPPPEVSYEESFSVIIKCTSEREQAKLLERLTGEGYDCKALLG